MPKKYKVLINKSVDYTRKGIPKGEPDVKVQNEELFFREIVIDDNDYAAIPQSVYLNNDYSYSYSPVSLMTAGFKLNTDFQYLTFFSFNNEIRDGNVIDVVKIDSLDPTLVRSGAKESLTIMFPGGNHIIFQSGNEGYSRNTFSVSFVGKNGVAVHKTYDGRSYKTGYIIRRVEREVFNYEYIIDRETNKYELREYLFLPQPRFEMDDTSWSPLFNEMNRYYIYPERIDGYIESPSNPPSQSHVSSFEEQADNMEKFWADIESYKSTAIYTIQTISDVGGSVNPTNAFASLNEPRMFTVTPDEHHAIHSVIAYNTLTNQQIPLQESGVDLLTGTKSYMFTMPAANVRIIVEFRSIEITIPITVKYTSPRGKIFTTSFNLLYDDTEQEAETAPPVEEGESNI